MEMLSRDHRVMVKVNITLKSLLGELCVLLGHRVLSFKQQQERYSFHAGNDISMDLQLSGRGWMLTPLELSVNVKET